MALGVLGALGAVVLLFSPPSEWADAAPGEQRLVIAPFQIDPSLRDWARSSFESSLAEKLSAEPNLIAHAGGDANQADYVLDASVVPDGHRVMITLRLRQAAKQAPTWTATFWRPGTDDSILARDFAVVVAEAVRATRR